jgi:hypothetical protein
MDKLVCPCLECWKKYKCWMIGGIGRVVKWERLSAAKIGVRCQVSEVRSRSLPAVSLAGSEDRGEKVRR